MKAAYEFIDNVLNAEEIDDKIMDKLNKLENVFNKIKDKNVNEDEKEDLKKLFKQVCIDVPQNKINEDNFNELLKQYF